MALVKRDYEIWLWDGRVSGFITNPITGEKRVKHKCDRSISIEDALTMYRDKLGKIRKALGMSSRDSSYSWDIELRAKDAVDAEKRLQDIHSSYVVTSPWGTVLVSADCLEEYLVELREENADAYVDIRKLSGQRSKVGDIVWDS